ncbi:hypothetical protein SSX86_032087 [Deinandra increscens subsp. villosa]|uniref:Uncharacterized protein n=1 Tax=Deinandra increscens subsp. villosa TaxID=3103831 RepID=A0AAP0GH43_9ASTR
MEMKKLVLSFSLCLVLISSVVESFEYHEKELETEEGLQGMYDRWRAHHKVTEKSPERFNVFKYNTEYVHNANKMNRQYKLELNAYAGMTHHEFSQTYGSSKIGHYTALSGLRKLRWAGGYQPGAGYSYQNATDIPKSIDWREKNAVTPVKNQGACGSCWAFSAVAAVESINAIRTGQLVRLSEQQLMDCDTSNGACNGGFMCSAFNFIRDHGGLATEESYPYKGEKQTCDKAKFGHHSVTLDGNEYLPLKDEEALLKSVAHQPVAVTVDAVSSMDMMFYKEGVFNGPCGVQMVHGVLAVGYGETPEGLKYWIIKNSWGDHWGEKGYMRLQRGVNLPEGACGINCEPNLPLKSPETRNIEL